MESYSTQAVLSVVDNNFTSKMKGAAASLSALEDGSKKANSSIMDIAKGVGIFKALAIAGNTLKESLSGAIDRFDTMTRFPKVMQNMGFSAESSNKSVQKLSDGIKGLPTSLDGITASTQKLAVLTGNLDKATNTSLALNNAFLASGAATADADRGLTQYTQMLSKGTVDMQSWRTLQETMGYALSETAKELGITSGNTLELYSAIQSGNITFDQLNDAMIECSTRTGGFADKAKTSSAGIKTSFANLGIAVTRGMANTIQSVNDSMNKMDGSTIQGKIESISGAVDVAFEGIAKGASVAIQALDLLGPSIVTVAGGFAAFQTALKVQDGWEKYHVAAKNAKVTIDAFRNAQQLAAQATLLSERAAQRQQTAENLSAKARQASSKAIQSETIAKESAVVATKTRIAVEKAATAEMKVRTAEENLAKATITLKAREETLAAAATKSKAVQEKAAAGVTRAKAAVDKKAIALEQAKSKAAKFGATSSELSAKAETLDMVATKAKANADKDALGASVAKASAEKAETFATEAGAVAEAKAAKAEEAGNIVKAKSNMLVIAKTAILGVLSGELTVVEAAQTAWNASMAANPIGAVIVATTALIAVMVGVTKALDKLLPSGQKAIDMKEEAVKSSKDLVDSLESSSKAYEDNISDVEANAKVNRELAENITKLSAKENKSVQDKAELKSYVDSLNSSMEGLNLQMDEETGALNMSTDAIMAKVEAYEAQEKAQNAQERYIEVMKEQKKVEEEQAELQEKRNTFEEEWQKLNNDGPAAMSKYTDSLIEMHEQSEKLKAKKQELAQSEEELKNIMIESQQAQSEAVNSGAESQKLTLEDLSETQQAAVQSMGETWQSYAEQATNMFDTLSDESDLSVAEMTANLQKNQQVIGDWANNIATLAERGVDQGLLEQLRQAGPESAGYVSAMVQASDEELQGLSDAFANGGETATTALKTAFDLAEVPDSVMGFVTKTKDSLSEQIAAADFAGIGRGVGQGFSNGVSESAEQASTASGAMAKRAEEATRTTLGIHSPSTVFQSIGADTVQGFVNGIQSSSGGLNAVMQSVMASVGQAAVMALNGAINGMSNVSTASFSKIAAAAKMGMGTMASEVSKGAQKSNSLMQSGMVAMNTCVQTNMRSMQVSAVSGMRAMTNAVNSGMNSSKASVQRGNAGMVAAVSSLQGSFYNSGFNASLGLARGIDSGAGSAIAAANRVASQVATIMANALKERSPSRITRKIGAYASEGLALGILDMARKVEAASLEVAEAAIPTGDIARRMAYAGESIINDASYAYAGTVNATYTIIIPLNVEGREVAKATAVFTQEELEKLERRNSRKQGYR